MSALRVEEIDGILVVAFSDSKIIDEPKIQLIGQELMECVDKAPNGKLLIDFTGVLIMSSAMIGKLVLMHKKCQSSGVTEKVCSVSDNVMGIFRTLKLTKVFDVQKDREKGLKAFDKRGWFG